VIRTIFNRPFIDLEPFVDLGELAALDDEICLGLAHVAVDYTGGSHRWMGITPPGRDDEAYADYGQVIERLGRDELAAFISLSDTPHAFDIDRRGEYEFGEERDWPLSRRQMLYLKYKYGVYFPWKVYYELMPNGKWGEKSSRADKEYTAEARAHFPRTIAFVEKLPFVEIGRCNLLGLEANDHGTVHRDGEPDKETVDHFITLCPRGNKRLFLWDDEGAREIAVRGRAYWFDDTNYHGVAADPFFRYSLRVDGIFDPAFLRQLACR
jgi:hypothetical protein